MRRLTRRLIGWLLVAAAWGCSKDNTVDASTTQCGDDSLDCVPCSAGEYRCEGEVLQVCQADGQGFDSVSVCVSDALCVKGLPSQACAEPICEAADATCDGTVMRLCAPGQDRYVETACPSVASCTAGLAAGKCAAGECSGPSECAGVDTACRKRTCEGGTCGFEDLAAGTSCNDVGSCDGAGNCVICTPGERECKDESTARVCESNAWTEEPCAGTADRCDRGQCVGGATLVWVPAQGGESGIDATEVTRSQYDTWLSTAPSMSGQPSYCAWNGSFTPDCEWPPGTKGGHPVVCVDWCDASAYCKAVGKRLCGKIGGGSNGYEDFADATTSQWHNACSSAGQHTYPYGDAYEALTCNGSEKGVGTTVVAGNLIGCQSSASGYAGVYDLSGNVWEWEDSCAAYAGTMDACLLRGGAFSGGVDYLRCDRVNHDSRHARFDSVGFRCCAR